MKHCNDSRSHALPVRFRRPSAATLLLLLLLVPIPSAGHESLVLGVHPYQPAGVLLERFGPLAARLEVTLDVPVEIRIGNNYEEHIHATGTGLVDLAFLGPAGYVNLTALFGEQRLLGKIVTNGQPVFRGHIVTAGKDAPATLADLAERRLAFVDPYSTMYLVPFSMLKQAGLTTEQLAGHFFLGSHHNVALGVLAGDFAAGAVKEDVYLQFADRGLHSLTPTMSIPEHVFVASHDLDETTFSVVRGVLLELGDSEEGRRALQSIKSSITGMAPAEDGDYDELRGLLKYLDGKDE